jgi:phage terminase large subunit-like protein
MADTQTPDESPTKIENEEIEQLKGQAQLAQNIFMNRSVSAEAALNLAKEFMTLVNKRFGETRFAKRMVGKAIDEATKKNAPDGDDKASESPLPPTQPVQS